MTDDVTPASLQLTLPPIWTELTRESLGPTLAALRGVGDDASAAALEEVAGEPSIVRRAVLVLPMMNADGSLAGIIFASLIAVTSPSDAVPDDDSPLFEPSIRRKVQGVGDHEASFLDVTLPVRSPGSGLAILLTFSTPNLPLADLMLDCFRSVAASAALLA